jgi:N utilization substance protein A
LAIGKEGQNVRLAAKLCGWKIDIKSHTQFFPDGEPEESEEEPIVPSEGAVVPSEEAVPKKSKSKKAPKVEMVDPTEDEKPKKTRAKKTASDVLTKEEIKEPTPKKTRSKK